MDILKILIGKTIDTIETSIVYHNGMPDELCHENNAYRITCTDGTVVAFTTSQNYDIAESNCLLIPLIFKSLTGDDSDASNPVWVRL